MKQILATLAALAASGSFTLGEPAPQLAKTDQMLMEEHFAANELPSNWAPGGRPKSFTIVDNALQGVAQPDDTHGPSIGVPVDAQNLTVAFRMKFAKPGYFLFLMDGKTPFGETDHLLRFGLSDSQAQLAQDRGTLASKRANQAGRTKTGKISVPTKDELADPKFHRTEMIAKEPAKIAGPEWHDVLIEQRGNDVRAQIDDKLVLQGAGTVVAGKKSRIVFLVGNSGTILIDDVRVWENQPK